MCAAWKTESPPLVAGHALLVHTGRNRCRSNPVHPPLVWSRHDRARLFPPEPDPDLLAMHVC